MDRSSLRQDVEALIQLHESEVRLRERARVLELDPAQAVEARRLFRLASTVRSERMELLDRCGLR